MPWRQMKMAWTVDMAMVTRRVTKIWKITNKYSRKMTTKKMTTK